LTRSGAQCNAVGARGGLQRGERWIAGLYFAHVKRAIILGEKTLGREAFHEALKQLMQENLLLFGLYRPYAISSLEPTTKLTCRVEHQ